MARQNVKKMTIKTPVGLLTDESIWKAKCFVNPHTKREEGFPKHSVNLEFDADGPGVEAFVTEVMRYVKNAVEAEDMPAAKLCLKTGEEINAAAAKKARKAGKPLTDKQEAAAEKREGKIYLRANTGEEYPPRRNLMRADANGQLVEAVEADIYAGCTVRCEITLAYWESELGLGVSAYLGRVVKVADGTPITYGGSAKMSEWSTDETTKVDPDELW